LSFVKTAIRIWAVIFCLGVLSSCDSGDQSSALKGLKSGTIEPAVGDLVPDFQLRDLDGSTFRLSDFEGSFVFLNFWATWCPPCIYEMPSMERLNRRFRTQPFNMIAVSVDDSVGDISSFLQRLSPKPSFLILHDPGKLVTEGYYGTEKFPETYLIGPNRRLLKKYEGPMEWTHPAVIEEIESFLPSNSVSKE